VNPGDAWDAYVIAQAAAADALTECGGSITPGTPQGDRATVLLDAADVAWSDFEAAALANPEPGS
jgi:hypothetical protein